MSNGCDRLEGIEKQIGKGSPDRSPPHFWEGIFYPKQYKERENKEVEAREKKTSLYERAISKSNSQIEDSSRQLQNEEEENQGEISTDKDQNDEEGATSTDVDLNERKGAPVIAKLNPLKDCAAKPLVKKSSFLQSLIVASEKTSDYRVWENEVRRTSRARALISIYIY